MINILIVMVAIISLAVAAPYLLAWRISKLGKFITSDYAPTKNPTFTCWVALKGKTFLTRQSIICRMYIYDDAIGFKTLWASQSFIKYSDIKRMERLLSGAKTTAFVITPIEKWNSENKVYISGVHEITKFIGAFRDASSIAVLEAEDKRSMLDFIR